MASPDATKPPPIDGGFVTSNRVRSGRLALAGQPGTAELAALLLGGASPHARVLVGHHRELKAGGLRSAGVADGLGAVDLLDRRAGGADREEQIRIGVLASGDRAPVVVGEVGGPADVREAAARLPQEPEDLEPLDEPEALDDASDDSAGDGLDPEPEEAEA